MARRKKRAAPATNAAGGATPEVNRKKERGEVRFEFQKHTVNRDIKRMNGEVQEIGETVS